MSTATRRRRPTTPADDLWASRRRHPTARPVPPRRRSKTYVGLLAVICILPTDLDQPAWLDGRTTGIIVAVGNGLLDLEQRLGDAGPPTPPDETTFETHRVQQA